jgi:hypothetical protein
MLRCLKKTALYGFYLFFLVCATTSKLAAQQEVRPMVTKFTAGFEVPGLPRDEPLDSRSRLLSMGAQIRETDLDCSHFVQYLYEQAGLYYGYAPSRILYDGMNGFRRVLHPKAGDLIVWRGHVGIVVDPRETTFLSALSSGVKMSSYQSRYWKKRGRPHFLRYVGARENTAPARATRKALTARAGPGRESRPLESQTLNAFLRSSSMTIHR